MYTPSQPTKGFRSRSSMRGSPIRLAFGPPDAEIDIEKDPLLASLESATNMPPLASLAADENLAVRVAAANSVAVWVGRV